MKTSYFSTRHVALCSLTLWCAILVPIIGCLDSSKSSKTEEKVVSYDNDPAANPMNASWTRPSQAGGNNQMLKNVDEVTGALHYGANVYYFAKVEDSFANSLSIFILNHTNLEVTAIAPNVFRMNGNSRRRQVGHYNYQGDYGAAAGYFVTFREK